MENASKALIFAGSVLISIVIISMLILVLNSLTSYQKVANNEETQKQVLEFNEQYEGFHRNGVRGNELYSLVSKVIDYNERKTEKSTVLDSTDNFEPMIITFTFDGKRKELTKLSENVLFKKNDYIFSEEAKTISNIETMKEIDNVKNFNLEEYSNNENIKSQNIKWSDSNLDSLVTAYDKIFISDEEFSDYLKSDVNSAIQTFYNFNSASGVEDYFVIEYNSQGRLVTNLKTLRNSLLKIKEQVDIYYEYVYFKRALFDCTGARYNQNTGRIVQLDFKFTGKFN